MLKKSKVLFVSMLVIVLMIAPVVAATPEISGTINVNQEVQNNGLGESGVITPYLNYESFTLKNGQRAVFKNFGDYFSITGGTEVTFYTEPSYNAIVTVGYIDTSGTEHTFWYGYAYDFTKEIPNTGQYYFFIRNNSSDPCTFSNTSITF